MHLRHAIAIAALGFGMPGCSGGSPGPGGGGAGGPPPNVTLIGTSTQGILESNGFLVGVDGATGNTTLRSGLGLGGARQIRSLAFDPNTDTLYAADQDVTVLLVIDPTTGVATPKSHAFGVEQMWSLAFDPNANKLYGLGLSQGLEEPLYSIDTITGIATPIGDLYPAGDIAFDPNTNTLYVVDLGPPAQLCTVDVSTGTKTVVGPIGPYGAGGLTFDPGTQSILGWSFNQGLVRIDPATGAGALIGPSSALVWCLGFDANRNRLYGWGGTYGGDLLSVDTSNGNVAVLGQTGRDYVSAIAFDPIERKLYAATAWTNELLEVDPLTGVGTRIGPLGLSGSDYIRALAFDPVSRTLYGSSNDDLWTIDVQTGSSTIVGPIGFSFVHALALDPETGSLIGSNDQQLIQIDRWTGAGTLLTTTEAYIWGLAFEPRSKKLYAVGSDFGRSFFTLDPTSGAVGQVVDSPTYPVPSFGLAFDPEADVFYSLQNDPARLVRIRRADGRATFVGGVASLQISGIAFDSRSGRTYGCDRYDGCLYDVDVSNGDATIVGWVGNLLDDLAYDSNADTFYCPGGGGLYRFDPSTGRRTWLPGPVGENLDAIAFDPNTDTLYGASGDLLRIDTATGVGTVIGPIGFPHVEGLAFDPVSNVLYGTTTGTDRLLLRIDIATGAGTVVGQTQFEIFALTARVEPP